MLRFLWMRNLGEMSGIPGCQHIMWLDPIIPAADRVYYRAMYGSKWTWSHDLPHIMAASAFPVWQPWQEATKGGFSRKSYYFLQKFAPTAVWGRFVSLNFLQLCKDFTCNFLKSLYCTLSPLLEQSLTSSSFLIRGHCPQKYAITLLTWQIRSTCVGVHVKTFQLCILQSPTSWGLLMIHLT